MSAILFILVDFIALNMVRKRLFSAAVRLSSNTAARTKNLLTFQLPTGVVGCWMEMTQILTIHMAAPPLPFLLGNAEPNFHPYVFVQRSFKNIAYRVPRLHSFTVGSISRSYFSKVIGNSFPFNQISSV